jgi:hypothetical protein
MEEKYINELYIKEFGVEKIEEINEAFSKAHSINDEYALTIINFLLDQSSLIIKEAEKYKFKADIFNFFYYIFIGIIFLIAETFKPIHFLALISPQIVPILFKIYEKIKK